MVAHQLASASKFPRNHRFVLGDWIEGNLYNLLETLMGRKPTHFVALGG